MSQIFSVKDKDMKMDRKYEKNADIKILESTVDMKYKNNKTVGSRIRNTNDAFYTPCIGRNILWSTINICCTIYLYILCCNVCS